MNKERRRIIDIRALTLKRPSSLRMISAVPAPTDPFCPASPPGMNGTEAVCGVGESGIARAAVWSVVNSCE